MEIEITQDEKLHKQFVVTYTRQDIQDCIEQEAQEMQPEVKANGFRPGKVPTDYIIRMYGEKLRIEAMNKKVSDDVRGLIEKNNLELAVNPVYKFREREETGDDKFYLDVDFYLFPDVPESDFSAVELQKLAPTETALDDIVDKNLMMLQVLTSEFEEKSEGAIEEHDRVSCKIDIAIEGEPAPALGGDLQVFVGHEQLPEEVEAQLVGMKKGEQKTFEHSYAEDVVNPFFAGVAGKTVSFDINVAEVSSPIIAELSEDKLKSMGFNDAEQLIGTLTDNTKQMIGKMADENLHKNVIDHIQKSYDFDVPEFVVDQEAHQIAYNEASRLGNFDAMKEVTEGAKAIEVSDEHRARAKNNLTTSFVLTDYARKNDIVVEEWEVKREMENHLEELTRMNNIRPEQKDKNYNEFVMRVKTLLFEKKVIASIIEKIKVNETFLSKDEFFEKVKVA